MIGKLHQVMVFNRRFRVLSDILSSLIPHGATVLDVGCGDGGLAAALQTMRPDIQIRGVDVLIREDSKIPVQQFDGRILPFADGSFDVILFSDVLHHTESPGELQREARRVSKRYILIKDHTRNGLLARLRLRIMDWAGNSRYGIALPYNYWAWRQWQGEWTKLGLAPERTIRNPRLYPPGLQLLFGSGLHFVALLSKSSAPARY